MNEICRLCCSNKYVNNDIFDEDNALYIKMSLYMPIKVFKNDKLPQKICDRCSCKVNDFYQFCNAAIEVQKRLHAILLLTPTTILDTIDFTNIKRSDSPIPHKCEQSTQTEDEIHTKDVGETTEVKEEPVASPKADPEEVKYDSDHCNDHHSDSSDDMCLLFLKNKKKTRNAVNGVGSGPKKKTKHFGTSILASVPEDDKHSLMPEDVKLEVKVESNDLELDEDVPTTDGVTHPQPRATYNCCVCLVQCYTKPDMLKHYRQHEEECRASLQVPPVPPLPTAAPDQPLRCTRCRKVVCGGSSEWAAHWARHWARDRKLLRCARCERGFADATAAFKHGLTHTFDSDVVQKEKQPSKRFVCDMCPQSFVYMRFLLAHRTHEHPTEAARPLELRCGQCSRQFAHLNSLRRHLRSHSGERNHLCNVCGKALTSHEHLKFHIRIHTGYKPYVCKTCGKGFAKKCNLTLHERVHSGEKPHVCSHCGKAFSQRSTLVIHERYHSGARPYVCALCGRGFVAKGLLSMHLKTTCI